MPRTAKAIKTSLRNFNLPDDLYASAKAIANSKGKDMTAYLIGLIENDVEENRKKSTKKR